MTTQTPRAAAAQTPPALVESSAARGQTPGTGDVKHSPVPGCHVTLTPGQLDTVLRALSDAAGYRHPEPDECDRCGDGLGFLCEDHVADAQLCVRYASLARRLRKAAGHD
jgi:hypothetical protein